MKAGLDGSTWDPRVFIQIRFSILNVLRDIL